MGVVLMMFVVLTSIYNTVFQLKDGMQNIV